MKGLSSKRARASHSSFSCERAPHPGRSSKPCCDGIRRSASSSLNLNRINCGQGHRSMVPRVLCSAKKTSWKIIPLLLLQKAKTNYNAVTILYWRVVNFMPPRTIPKLISDGTKRPANVQVRFLLSGELRPGPQLQVSYDHVCGCPI